MQGSQTGPRTLCGHGRHPGATDTNPCTCWTSGSAGRCRDRVSRCLQGLRGQRRRSRGRNVRRPARGVRLPRRLDGIGQVDRDAPADQGARAHGRHDPRGGPRADRDRPQARAALPAQHRRGLPGLQAASEPHRLRQRRLRPAGHRRLAARDPREGSRHPAAHGALDQAPQLPRPALRWRAAARERRARVRQPSAAGARRRADRQPRPRDVGRDHAAALPDQPRRGDRARGDPRLAPRRPDAPARDRAPGRPHHPRRGNRSLPPDRAEHRRVRRHASRARQADPAPCADSAQRRRPVRRGVRGKGLRRVRLGFFVREALRSMRRNAIPSFAAMASVLVTVLVLGVFIPVVQATTGAANEVRSRVLVDVYMKSRATDTDVERVRRLLTEKTPHVKNVEYVSKADAYAQERRRNPEAYSLLGSNPLPDTFRVTPDDPDNVLKLRDALSPQTAAGGRTLIDPAMESVRNRKDETTKILTATRVIKLTMGLLAVLLIIASVLLISNPIRLSRFSRRREVEVMKLVGATDWFIRWPFMLEGVFLGALGGIVAILLLAVGKGALVDPLAQDFALIAAPRTIDFAALVAILLVASVLVSAAGSGLSLRRFLRV